MSAIGTSVFEELEMQDAGFAIAELGNATPLSRYIQFRIYADLVHGLETKDKLPAGVVADFNLKAWISGGRSA